MRTRSPIGMACACGFAVFGLALVLRVASLPTAFHDGNPQIVPLDDLYHAKRIVFSAAHFPKVLDWDPDRGLGGSFCPWPPLYDLAMGGEARLLGAHGIRQVLRDVVWVPPLFSSLFAALAAAYLALRVGLPAGMTSGLLLALSPSLVGVSRLGTIDHHFLEPALAAGIVGAAAMALGVLGSPGSVWRRALFFGLALATALFIQTAMLLVAGLALVAILLLGRGRVSLASAGLGFSLAAAAVLAYRAGRPPGYPNDAWYLGTPHAAALLAAAAACGGTAWMRGSDGRRGWVGSALLGAAFGGLTLASIPGALTGIAQGAGFLGGDPWLREIQEFRPLFRGTLAGALDDFLVLGGGAVLAIPFAIRSFRGGGPVRRLLSVFAIGLLLAAIRSARLGVPAAAILTVPAALLVSDEIRRRRFGLAGALAVVALAPGVVGFIRILPEVRSIVPPAAEPMLDAANYLKAHGGSSGRALAPWWAGHVFDVVGAHPVIVDNFGAAEGRQLFDDAVGILLSPREEAVERYCRDHGIRFVAIENPIGAVPPTARMLELPVSLYFTPVAAPTGGRPLFAPTPLLRASFWWRAYLGPESPSRSEPGSPFRRFRLLYPDPARFGDRLPYGSHALQIWEVLPPGA